MTTRARSRDADGGAARIRICWRADRSRQPSGEAQPDCRRASAAFLAVPGFDAFPYGQTGDTQRDDRVQPPPAEQGVGQQPGQYRDGQVGAQQVLGASPAVAAESSRAPRRRLATPRAGIAISDAMASPMPSQLVRAWSRSAKVVTAS